LTSVSGHTDKRRRKEEGENEYWDIFNVLFGYLVIIMCDNYHVTMTV
jgi:hypothetical protein